MFGIYLKRELSRRKKAALVIALGLALGIALVITVNSVSAGMPQAQDKVLKSLYGLGTDMTVTKAAAAQTGTSPSARASSSTPSRQRLRRGAEQRPGDDPGLQTLTSSLGHQGRRAEGRVGRGRRAEPPSHQGRRPFTQGKATVTTSEHRRQQGGPAASSGGRQRRRAAVQGGGADFDVNYYSVDGADVTKPDLGPLTSSKITTRHAPSRPRRPTRRSRSLEQRRTPRRRSYKVGETVTINGVKYKVIGIATPDSGDVGGQPLHAAEAGPDAQRLQGQGHHDLRQGDRLAADRRGQVDHPEEHLRVRRSPPPPTSPTPSPAPCPPPPTSPPASASGCPSRCSSPRSWSPACSPPRPSPAGCGSSAR